MKPAHEIKPGRLGNLTNEQEKMLKDMKEKLASDKLDDHAYLRFLRARKWDLNAAIGMAQNDLKWRADNHIDDALNHVPPKLELFGKLVKHAHHKFTKAGHPIYIEKTGRIHASQLTEKFTIDEIVHIHTYSQEFTRQRCRESSQAHGHHIETSVQIIDLGGLTLGHGVVLKFMKAYADLDAPHYPEFLEKLFIINAPSAFPILWSMAKPWIDPVTRSKIEVLGSNYKQTLLKYIDAESLPEEYGGKCHCQGGCIPAPDLGAPVNLSPKARHVQEVKCGPYGADIEWIFTTESDDVVFSAEFLPHSDEAKKVVVVAPCRPVCDAIPEQGHYVAKENGFLRLVWANAHSIFYNKTIRFNVTVDEFKEPFVEQRPSIMQGHDEDSKLVAAN